MLIKEQETILTDTFGMNIEALKTALTSDKEEKIEFKSGTFLDEEKLTALKETVKKEGYNEGKVAGVEMEAKAIKEKYGLNIEGKDFSKILDTYGKKVIADAKIPADKKNLELSESLSNLQKKYETDLGLKDQQLTGLQNDLKQTKINNELQQYVPAGIKGLKPNQAVILAKTEFEFDYTDTGQLIAKKNGTILKDNLEKPIPVDSVMVDFAKNNGWLDVDGRGGGNEGGTPSGFKTMFDVQKHMEENKIDPLSHEGQKLVADFNNKK